MANVQAAKTELAMAAGNGQRRVGALKADQETALESLVLGKSVAETARTAGVSRTTIYEWLRHDPVFQAAYNQWHDQLEENCRSRLLALSDKATDAIEKAVEKGDARAAMQLLKGMGLIRPKAAGPTDAEEIKLRAEIENEENRIALKRRKGRLKIDEIGAAEGL